MDGLLLSLFPGIDMFGRAFEELGYCVVRGPDRLWGGDIDRFHPRPGAFEGIIAGPPCQDFSRARRCAPSGAGEYLCKRVVSIVESVRPEWYLIENVPQVPDLPVPGYFLQRLNLNSRELGMAQHRLRCFQFGCRSCAKLVIERQYKTVVPLARCALASEGRRARRRSFADFCELQGLPRDFDLPGMSRAAKYQAVGNGVPLPMGRAVAIAVQTRRVTTGLRLCICECGRTCDSDRLHATPSCRKRMERRRRVMTGVTVPGPVTAAGSLFDVDGGSGNSRAEGQA